MWQNYCIGEKQSKGRMSGKCIQYIHSFRIMATIEMETQEMRYREGTHE